jgi:E1A/CREB-binding protein
MGSGNVEFGLLTLWSCGVQQARRRVKVRKKKGPKTKAPATRKNKSAFTHSGGDLAAKLMAIMEKNREVSCFNTECLGPLFCPSSMELDCCVTCFRCSLSHCTQGTTGPIDPDPIMQCDLMDGRDAFLQMARERHWEFGTLRQTKFSSMAMLYELHTQNRDSSFMYTCNTCKAHVETRWHCNVCEDFDLCVQCYEKEQHMHKLEKLASIWTRRCQRLRGSRTRRRHVACRYRSVSSHWYTRVNVAMLTAALLHVRR